jgi:hypothetical protein
MSGPSAAHWHELSVLLQKNPASAARRLRWPCPTPPPPEPFLTECSDLANQQKLGPLFARHLLSTLALPTTLRPRPDHLIHPDLPPLLSDYPPDTLFRGRWLCLPVLTCQGASGSLTWVLLGQIPDVHGCAFVGEPFPEESSRDAACIAWQVVQPRLHHRATGFLALSLQHPDDPPITGGSLGLPLALGLLLLDRELTWPDGVYASGGMTADGRLLPVAGEMIKHLHVRQRMRTLLLPETGLTEATPDAKTIRCSHVDQAYFALNCVVGGLNAEKIQYYRACLSNPGLFLDQFSSLPTELLALADGRSLLAQIAAERHRLLPALARCLAACHNDPHRAALFADLFSPDEIRALAEQDEDEEMATHRWCVARIACGNRSGSVAANQTWIDLGQKLGTSATPREIADFANHGFVAARFNRYDFRPEPPEEFSFCLALEEQLYQARPGDTRELGAMYGTLAQNYGFCGPQWRPQLEQFAQKAATAFGRRFRRESRRLLAYRLYGLMDAAMLTEAATLLNHYLDLPIATQEPQAWIDALWKLYQNPTEHTPFQIAVTCRLLAERSTGGHNLPPVPSLLALVSCLPAVLVHPWQLTACNLGRLFIANGLYDRGNDLLHRSLDTCLQGGETMRVMALLPLSLLNHEQPTDPTYSATCAAVLETIRGSELLNQDHFRPLLDAPHPKHALTDVFRDPGRFFPFSYR